MRRMLNAGAFYFLSHLCFAAPTYQLPFFLTISYDPAGTGFH
jgi:hypothetical protein